MTPVDASMLNRLHGARLDSLQTLDHIYVGVFDTNPRTPAKAKDIAVNTLRHYLTSKGIAAKRLRPVKAAREHPEKRVNPTGVPHWVVYIEVEW